MKIKTNDRTNDIHYHLLAAAYGGKTKTCAEADDRNRQVSKAFVARLLLILLLAIGVAGSVKAAAANHGNYSPGQCTAQQGQLFIEQGRYDQAIREFSCIIAAQPTEVEGYRGRIEAEILLGKYSDAVRDYTRITALVMPVHPNAETIIMDSYNARLSIEPENIPALAGASFARWWFFDYAQAIHLLNRLLSVQPSSLYGNLFRGSSRLLRGATRAAGVADIELAISLAPQSANVRFIVADAYTYGLIDPQRALAEATLALNWGLDIPRIHAILANAYLAFGDQQAAATHFQRHIQLVTNQLIKTSPLPADTSMDINLVPGRTYEIPVVAIAGETISLATYSRDFPDSILVLLAPDGTPVVGNDDYKKYFAGLEWVAGVTGNYRLQVTSFEGVSTGKLTVTRN